MLRRTLHCALVVLSVACGNSWQARLAAGAPTQSVASPQRDGLPTHRAQRAAVLVQQALDAELAGDAKLRGEFLAKAMAADPDYAPARWHNGQVKFQGEWKSVSDVGRQISGDPRWAEYRQRRRALTGSVDEHVELATRCERGQLAEEARYHWANVLLADPGNKLARERLGLQPYRGGLYTAEQVAKQEQWLKQSKKDFEKFKPELVKLCARAVTRAAGAEAALAEIAAIGDDAKIDSLDFAVDRACRKAREESATELQQAHVAALSRMPHHAATLRLLNYAVLSPSEEIRVRATQGLLSRPATDYVPLLMAALTAPYEADTAVFAAPDGTVRLLQTIRQEGPEASRTHVAALNLETEGALKFDKAESNPAAVLQGNLARAEVAASQTREMIDAANAAAAERNKRIGQVLKGATGTEPGDSVSTWWQAWQDYNELSYPGERAEFKTSYEESYTYIYPQEKPMYLEDNPYTPPEDGQAITYTATPYTPPVTPVRTTGGVECFAAGTPVWTKSGPAPIESIGVGEMVLAQDPLTGELAYRVVLQTTVSEPVRVVALKLPKETITSTLGHRFWVDGRGWEMAKSLKPAARLHAMDGGVQASSAAVDELTVCHNLVVDEFHTYFVGESKLLAHDKTCPAPNPANLPGSARPREASPADQQFAAALANAERP